MHAIKKSSTLARADSPPLPPLPRCYRTFTTPDRLGGYRLGARIGFGGMGDVYRATHDLHPGHCFAAKVLHPELRQARFLEAFDNECRAVARMSHRNIARCVDWGHEGVQCPYLIQQRIEGEDLATHCKRKGQSIGQRIVIFLQVCEGVEHIHRNGVLHRDLKPANILVASHGRMPIAKIIDFGLARCNPHLNVPPTDPGGVALAIGTVPYMSPERAGEPPTGEDERSDVFSLGAILFELLTGTTPLAGVLRHDESIERQLWHVRHQQAVRPSTRLRTDFDWSRGGSRLSGRGALSAVIKRLDDVVMTALANDPTLRQSSAGELARQVSAAVSGERRVVPSH